MHLDCRELLLWMILTVSILQVVAETRKNLTQISACPKMSNRPTSLHFRALKPTTSPASMVAGCVHLGSTVEEKYKENHVIHVKNDRAATVYLTVNGIYNRTTKSLPQYKEYKYEFALFSNKDVTWLVTVENMPSNNLSYYKFYRSAGSTIIFRDRSNFPTVEFTVGDSTNLLDWCRTVGVYAHEDITSFSELKVPKVAKITIKPLQSIVSDPQYKESSTGCYKLAEDFHSPLVSYQLYGADMPKIGCEKCSFPPNVLPPTIARAFILDLVGNRESVGTVEVEIGGNLQMESGTQQQTVVVLRSSSVTQWNVHVEEELKSHNFLFVSEKKDKLVLVGPMSNTEAASSNLDYSNHDLSLLINSTEALYNSKVISYMQYDLPTELIFLTVSAHVGDSNAPLTSQSDNQLAAKGIYEQIEFDCNLSKWWMTVPIAALQIYGFSKDNLKVGDGECPPLIENADILFYDLTRCQATEDHGMYRSQLEILPKLTQSERDIFLPTNDDSMENVKIPLECTIQTLSDLKMKIRESIKSSCKEDTLVLQIPEDHLKYIDLVALEDCKNVSSIVYVEYFFPKDGAEKCRMVYNKGVCEMKMPLDREQTTDLYVKPDETMYLVVSSSSMPATPSYSLKVFDDFDMTKMVHFPANVALEESSTVKRTFHVKVSITSGDSSLMVHLSRCTIEGSGISPRPIIIHNCPTDESVSFVRPYSARATKGQHFTVNMTTFLKDETEIFIQCEVSACTFDDMDEADAVSIPMCLHIHGDNCRTTSVLLDYHLAPYSLGSIKSGTFVHTLHSALQKGGEKYGLEVGKEPTAEKTQSGMTNWFVTLLLGMAAFLLGCGMVFIMWRIDRNSYRRPQGPNPKGPQTSSTRCECNSSNGSSQSTNSTKTTGSSSKSLPCFGKSEKEPKPPSSKDDMMSMKPLIPSDPVISPPQGKMKMMPISQSSCAVVRSPPDIVQDGRHMFISGGRGYLGMPIKSTKPNCDDFVRQLSPSIWPEKPTPETSNQQPQKPVQSKPDQSADDDSEARPQAIAQQNVMETELPEHIDKGNMSEVMVHRPYQDAADDSHTSSSPQTATDCLMQPWPTDDRMVPAVKYRLQKLKEVAL